MKWAKNNYAKTHIFAKNLITICKSLYSGYNYFGLQNMCSKPNIS